VSALVPLEWDSRLLGLSCARLEFAEECGLGPRAVASAVGRAFAAGASAGVRAELVAAKIQPEDCDVRMLSEEAPDRRIVALGREWTFRSPAGAFAGPLPENVAFARAANGGTDPVPFLPLAADMRHSRYYLDPDVGEDRALAVWEASITGHCQGFAQEIAVASLGGRPAGLATIHLEDGAARLHIVGVLGWARGRGVGARLMRAVLARHGEARAVTVEAFAENQAAVGLYRAVGFSPVAEHVVLHFWRRG